MSGDDSGGDRDPNPALAAFQAVTPDVIRRSFAIKFGLVLVVMAASIGVIGLAATSTISDETRQNVESEYLGVAQQESDIIEEWLQRNELVTGQLSQSGEYQADSVQDLQFRLTNKLTELPDDVSELHLFERGSDGYSVLASTALSQDTNIDESDRSWFLENETHQQITGQDADTVYITDTYAVGSERYVAFVSQIGGQGGRYLVSEVSVFQVTSSLQGANRAEGGFSQIVDAETDQVMISEVGEETLSPYATSDSALEPIQAAEDIRGTDQTAIIRSSMSGTDEVIPETYTVAAAPIDGKDWVVAVHAPRGNVFGFVQTISNYGLLATLGMILLIGAIGAALGYSTSSAIDRLTAKTEEMREGNLDVTLSTSRIDNIGRLYDGFADMRDSLKAQIDEAERARKEAEVSRAEAVELSNYLQEKAEEYSQIMQECAAGDLTRRMEKDGEEESMDRIADEFNDMIGELEKTTGQLKSYVDEVETAGAEVEESANTVRGASEQVADSIQTISDDAYDQKERLQDVSETMDGLAADLDDLAAEHPNVDFGDSLDRIRGVSAAIEETARLGESTMSEAENVAGAAEEQAAELNEVSERANDLQRYAQPLRDILDRFETEAEHEFVFSVGPTGSGPAPEGGDESEDGSDGAEPGADTAVEGTDDPSADK